MIKNENNILFLLHADWYDLFSDLIKKLRTEDFNIFIHFYERTLLNRRMYLNDEVTFLESNKIYNFVSTLLYKGIKYDNSICEIIREKIIHLEHIYNYNYAKKYLTKNKIKLIISHTDISYRLEISYQKAAKDLGIPVIIPSVISMEPDLSQIRGHKNYTLTNSSNLYQKRIFNKFKSKEFGVQIIENHFRYRSYVINFLNKIDSLSFAPFVFGGSPNTSSVCISSNYLKNISIKNGVLSSKIEILGDINGDKLYNTFINKESIRKLYSLNNEKIIIIALPQLYEHNYFSKKVSMEYIDFLVKYPSSLTGVKILISLHPMMKIETYKFLEDIYNCEILKSPLNQVLPIADIFICVPSNTLVWSTLCSIKTIVFDVFSWDFKLMNELKSVFIVKCMDDYSKLINKCINTEINFKDDHLLLSKNDVFDGKSIYRHIELIKRKINEK